LGCSVSHSRRKEKWWADLEDALVAGKGLGEDVMKPSRRRQGRKSKGGESRKEGEGGRKQR